MTQAVLRLWNGTTLDRDLNDGARYALDGEYAPGLPQLTEDELFDLVTPVTDEIPLHVIGCTRDELSDNLAALNTALYRAARYMRDRNQGSVRRLEFAPSGSKYTVWNDILGGSANWSGPVEGATRRGELMRPATVRIRRRPVWEGTETTITPTTSATTNGNLSRLVLGTLLGDLPARCKLTVTTAYTNAQRILVAYRADGPSPSAKPRYLLTSGNPTGISVTAGTGVVIAAQSNFISGNRARYTPTGTSEVTILRWEITAPFNVQNFFGRFLGIVRYQDRSTSVNFKLRYRSFVKYASGNYQYGAWGSDLVTTLYTDTGANPIECGTLDLGQTQSPPIDTEGDTVVTVGWELAATAIAASGALDIDVLGLYPLSESDEGKGLLAAEFPYALSTNKMVIDSRVRKMQAYVTNTADVTLVYASELPAGGELLLWPAQSNHTLDVLVTRDASNYYKHDASKALSASLTYVPRFIHVRGST